jgi:hypothetical protein
LRKIGTCHRKTVLFQGECGIYCKSYHKTTTKIEMPRRYVKLKLRAMNANGKNETILPGIFMSGDKIFSMVVSMLTYQLRIRIPLMPIEGVIWPGTLQDPYRKENTKITFI